MALQHLSGRTLSGATQIRLLHRPPMAERSQQW